MRRRPIGGTQYLTAVTESPEDRQARDAKERGVRVRVSGGHLTIPDDPDDRPVFDGAEPGCLLDPRGS